MNYFILTTRNEVLYSRQIPPQPFSPETLSGGWEHSLIHIRDSGHWGHTWAWLSTPLPFWMFQRPPQLSPEETYEWLKALHSQSWTQASRSPLATCKRYKHYIQSSETKGQVPKSTKHKNSLAIFLSSTVPQQGQFYKSTLGNDLMAYNLQA